MRALTLKGSKEIKVHMHIHSSWVQCPVSEYHSVLDYHSAFDGRNHVFAHTKQRHSLCTDPPPLRFFLRGGGVCTQAS